MSKQEFKVGDNVRLKSQGKFGATWDVDMTVSKLRNDLPWSISVTTSQGATGAFKEAELELVEPEFKAGDRVELVEDYPMWASKGDRGTVVHINGEGTVDVDYDEGEKGLGTYTKRLKLVEEVAEAIEQEPEAQPVTYRICVGTTIGNVEYASIEAAKEAALIHGNNDEQFSIFEVVKVADFRVKVEKTLEDVKCS